MPEARARVVLAFDFGLRRIGVAAGDTVSNAAAPRSAVRVGDHGIDWPAIERLLQQYQPDLLIVGSPRHADGSPSPLGVRADQFAAALGARARRPVQRTDEYASSIEAAAELARLRSSGQRRRRVQHADIDSAAAAIILERWLLGEGRVDDDGR
jgi:putative Holliday junction resolvase